MVFRSARSASSAPGYWILTATSRPSAHTALVHLADAGRGHRGVVELGESLPPFGAKLRVEHPVHLVGGQRRRILLQLGQRFAVRLAELLWNGSFHHRQGLADLHRAALELPENGEELLGRFFHEFGVDLVLRFAGQPLAEPECCPARDATGEAGQLCVTCSAPAFDVCHASIIHDEPVVALLIWEPTMSAGTQWIFGHCRT